VGKNYEIICNALNIDPNGLVFARQVHGVDVRRVGLRDRLGPLDPACFDADGMVTDEDGAALVIFAADCAPILLHDPVRGAVGAVHAGWRGTLADIAGAAVGAMSVQLGCDPSDIRAAIGPCISRCCFETHGDVADAVCAVFPGGGGFVRARGDGKYDVDLKGCNIALLMRAGIREKHITVSGECTCCRSDKYWSHRATHGRRGSQAAFIALRETARI
jgi:YfiH family protein